MNNQQQLSSQQYELILKYMETTSQQNFQTATLILKNHAFNLNAAINSKFGNSINNPNNQMEQQQNLRNDRNDQEIVFEYIRFIKQKHQNSSLFFGIYSFVKGLVFGILKGITQLLLPQSLKNKYFRSPFYHLYKQSLKVNLNEDSFEKLLQKCYSTRKPIICAISQVQNKHNSFVDVFNHPRIAKKINESFLFLGSLQNQSKLNNISSQQKKPPTVIIFRINVFQKIQIIKTYIGEQEIEIITVQQLNRILQKVQNMCKRDRNVQIKYRNHMRRIQYGGYAGFYQQEQQQLYPQRGRINSQMIRQQNQDYKKIQQQNMKKIKQLQQQEQKKRQSLIQQQQMIQERKVRKMSIPDEPMQGQIVRINFRCPDGGTKIRNFLMDEKLQLVYNWVQTNQQIQFQDNNKRNFQLLYSFPPSPLCSKKDQYLKDIFDSDQEKLMIREL